LEIGCDWKTRRVRRLSIGVVSDEFDPAKNWISIDSPVDWADWGNEGDEVPVRRAVGLATFSSLSKSTTCRWRCNNSSYLTKNYKTEWPNKATPFCVNNFDSTRDG
jgi:hypothetical protein